MRQTNSCYKPSVKFACLSHGKWPWDNNHTFTVERLERLYTHTCAHIRTQSYLAWGTSILEETTLRFCSSRDTDRVSGSRPARLTSTIRCSSTTSGLWEPSPFWLSGAPLVELCWGGMQGRVSKCLGREPCTQDRNNADIGTSCEECVCKPHCKNKPPV